MKISAENWEKDAKQWNEMVLEPVIGFMNDFSLLDFRFDKYSPFNYSLSYGFLLYFSLLLMFIWLQVIKMNEP